MSNTSPSDLKWRESLGKIAAAAVTPTPMTVALGAVVGVLGGLGSALFAAIIDLVHWASLGFVLQQTYYHWIWYGGVIIVPALGLLLVSWITQKFAPEAAGNGVPEVIVAVARKDGFIRPRIAAIKAITSAVCIGTGGSIGREGPIVQIGAALGSMFGRFFKLSPQNVKVLVAAGSAAGISASFNAPLAGVIFAGEIILGSFAVESLTAVVVAAVLADVIQEQLGTAPPYPQMFFQFQGEWSQLPSFIVLGLICGGFAVSFTKMVFASEDLSKKYLPQWWMRAIILGCLVGLSGVVYPLVPPSKQADISAAELATMTPPLMSMGHDAVEHTIHLENTATKAEGVTDGVDVAAHSEHAVEIDPVQLLAEFWWLLPLAFLKPIITSLTLSGGGSGGIFAPSLFIGATAGGAFGLLCNLIAPGMSAHPGAYAIVGMGAVVAGTTHGTLSAIVIVYEMTNDYHFILPIMIAAGLSSMIAEAIDPESIYYKKLSRRGEFISRGHDMHRLEHIMVRDVMVRVFPSVRNTDDAAEIIRVARENPDFECLPVMNEEGKLTGIIRPEDLHRLIDTELAPHMINADDVAIPSTISATPDENLLEALRDFGKRDIETLPVESRHGNSRRLVGLLLRNDVMKRYREELLKH